MPKGIRQDLTGERFGSWIVLRRHAVVKTKVLYLCLCTGCKNEFPVQAGNLVAGRSTQCHSCRYRSTWTTRETP